MRLTALQQYGIVTTNYWAFTLTDGALRMLVIFHFHSLGYTTLEIAFLFLFYEFFGVITNLYGGWIGARYGLRLTLWVGTLLQIGALLMLIPVSSGWSKLLSVIYVMVAQAISGIAKDLNKMSAKSAIKTVVPDSSEEDGGNNQLFKWVAILTGSKNALKGVGFFLGGLLLTSFGFNKAVELMAIGLGLSFLMTLILPGDIGKMKNKPIFKDLFSKSQGINVLSFARFFLFGARDVWFVVALPVFLETYLNWNFSEIGAFLGLWVIGYGFIQAFAPSLRNLWGNKTSPGVSSVQFWSACLNCDTCANSNSTMATKQSRNSNYSWIDIIWVHICNELINTFIYGSCLYGQGKRESKRRLLLHGKCGRETDWYSPIRSFIHAWS